MEQTGGPAYVELFTANINNPHTRRAYVLTTLVPLIDRKMHERFEALRAEMIRNAIGNTAHVFVPVGAESEPAVPIAPKVLFVGKATRSWCEDRVGSRDRAAEILKTWLRGDVRHFGSSRERFYGRPCQPVTSQFRTTNYRTSGAGRT